MEKFRQFLVKNDVLDEYCNGLLRRNTPVEIRYESLINYITWYNTDVPADTWSSLHSIWMYKCLDNNPMIRFPNTETFVKHLQYSKKQRILEKLSNFK